MTDLNYMGMVEALLVVKIDEVTEWEELFLIDIKKRYAKCPDKLSVRQREVIKNIHEKYIVKQGRP